MPIPKKISEIQASLSSLEFTCQELLESYLQQIEQNNPNLNALLEVDHEGAMEYARRVDERLILKQPLKPLEGIFLTIKDTIHVEGFHTTCASKILKNYKPPFEAHCVKLLKEAGAYVLAKNNCDEFAMGSSNENSAYGTAKNPCSTDHVPGGSSGGSASAVRANFCLGSLGSDTGGSIRQPAAFCGVVGFKPTYGRVSRRGLVAFASSLDQVGPITNNVEDAHRLFQVISGFDELDSTCVRMPTIPGSLETSLKGTKLGVIQEFFPPELDPRVKKEIDHLLELFEDAGGQLVSISIPHLKYSLPAYYILASAEASSNLSRFDSIRYGSRQFSDLDLNALYALERSEGFGDEVIRRIILGTFVLSSGYYEAFYRKAQRIRSLIKSEFEEALTKCDALAGPTTPTPAFAIGSKITDPIEMYHSDLFTVPANICSSPAISIPCGDTEENLPIGFQLIGRAMEDEKVLSIAMALEGLL